MKNYIPLKKQKLSQQLIENIDGCNITTSKI